MWATRQLQWEYDRLGNRRNQTLTGGNASVPQPQLTISETTNRITDAGFAYDAAGNMTNDSLHTYAYDAENRIKTVDSTGATYSYVGALRVKRVVGGTTVVYIYSGSKVMAEYVNGTLINEYVSAGSQTVATVRASDGAVTYHHPDHLSERVRSDGSGELAWLGGNFPFGETWYEAGGATPWKFTSYQRDDESGLDYAMFRYDSSRLGRFMSPDLLGGYVDDPQSLNRYSYVGNDPINLIDPLGLECVWDDGSFDSADDPSTNTAELCAAAGGTWLDPTDFGNLGLGDWSPNPNSDLASSITGDPNAPTFYALGEAPMPFDPTVASTWVTDPTDFVGPAPNKVVREDKVEAIEPKALSPLERFLLKLACYVGLDPDYAAPIRMSQEQPTPRDSMDSTESTEGQKWARGPRAEIPSTGVGVAAHASSVAECLSNVAKWPQK